MQINRYYRDQFNDRTVLTIAHRLDTIIDYDRILVVDNGKLVEHGSPFDLTSNKESHFYKMAAESKDFDHLIKMVE